MNKTLIFFCLACALLFLSIVTICTAPIINSLLGFDGNQNCQIYADKKDKEDGLTDKEKDLLDRGKNLCNREKAMYGLEYASFISDLILGFICALLSLLHFFGVGNSFEKFTGIIGLICGIIGFILTLIYIIYSGYIFTHDGGITYSHSGPSYSGSFYKIDKDRKYAEWDDSKSQYKCLYYDKDDITAAFAKYQDMGKKQYNYHKDYYFADNDSEYKKCSKDYYQITNFEDICSGQINSLLNGCKNLYIKGFNDFEYKYKYDRWVTTIIFGCFIIALNLGLAIFGFLLFNQAGGSSGFVSAQ
jgi:hypothetical protein